MRVRSVISLFAVLFLPTVAFAEVQTFTATHTYILGDHDSKDDARQRCLLEIKRKILEQAGVYIESASEVKDLQLTKDKITSFAAAVMQVKGTKEEVGFEQGHMSLTLTITAQVDLEEVRKQLAARQVDANMQERLKRLEMQLEAMMQQQQGGQVPGHAPMPPASGISDEDLQTLRSQAAQSHADAQFKLGLRYAQGQGVPQDYATARQWFEKAAAQGDAKAQTILGGLYHEGLGVPQDYGMARQWFEKAAAQGNVWAQSVLGELYYNGDGVPQDYVQARQWYAKAAAQGNADAQTGLAQLYAQGQGVPQDYTTARGWYEKAAAQGNAGAQYALGTMYNLGKGVPEDYGMARQWYEKAAAQGDARAQAALGLLYWVGGHGVRQDNVRAYMWWNLAAAHLTGGAQKVAADGRDVVAGRMTPAQITEAQRLAQQCQAQQFKGC